VIGSEPKFSYQKSDARFPRKFGVPSNIRAFVIWGTLCFGLPILAAIISVLVVTMFPRGIEGSYRAVAASVIFATCAAGFASLVDLRLKFELLNRSRTFTLAIAAWVCIPIMVLFGGEGITVLAAVAIYLGAASEELVFRDVFPKKLNEKLSARGVGGPSATVMSVLLMQLSFAAAHFLFQSLSVVSLQELFRLFVIGILYAELFKIFGLGFVSILHALTNFWIRTQSYAPPSINPLLLTVFAGIAVLILARRALTDGRRPVIDLQQLGIESKSYSEVLLK
jgi:hypothetical protein